MRGCAWLCVALVVATVFCGLVAAEEEGDALARVHQMEASELNAGEAAAACLHPPCGADVTELDAIPEPKLGATQGDSPATDDSVIASETAAMQQEISQSSMEADRAASELAQAEASKAEQEERSAEDTKQATEKEAALEAVEAEEAKAEKAAKNAEDAEKEAEKTKAKAEVQKRHDEAEARKLHQKEMEDARKVAAANRTEARKQQELNSAQVDYDLKHKAFQEAKDKFLNATQHREEAENKMSEVAEALGLSDAAWKTASGDASSSLSAEEAAQRAMFEAGLSAAGADSKASQAMQAMLLAERRAKDGRNTANAAGLTADRMGPLADAAAAALGDAEAAARQIEREKGEVLKMATMLSKLGHETEEDQAKALDWHDKADKAHEEAAAILREAHAATKKREEEHAALLKAQLAAEKSETDFEKFEDYLSHLADRTKELESQAAVAKKAMSDVNDKVQEARSERKKLEQKVNKEARAEIPTGTDIDKAQKMLLNKKQNAHEAIDKLHMAIDQEHMLLDQLKEVHNQVQATAPLAVATREKLNAALKRSKDMEAAKNGLVHDSDKIGAESLKQDKSAEQLDEESQKLAAEAATDDEKAAGADEVAGAAKDKFRQLQGDEDEEAQEVVDDLKDMATRAGVSENVTAAIEMELRKQKVKVEAAQKTHAEQEAKKQEVVERLTEVEKKVNELQGLELEAEAAVQAAKQKLSSAAAEGARTEAAAEMKDAQMKRLEATEALDDVKVAQAAAQAELAAAKAHSEATQEHRKAWEDSIKAKQEHQDKNNVVEAAKSEIEKAMEAKAAADATLDLARTNATQAETPEAQNAAKAALDTAKAASDAANAQLDAAEEAQAEAEEAAKVAAFTSAQAKVQAMQKRADVQNHAKEEVKKVMQEAKEKLALALTAEEKEAAEQVLSLADRNYKAALLAWSKAQEAAEEQAEKDAFDIQDDAMATAADTASEYQGAESSYQGAETDIEEGKKRLDAAVSALNVTVNETNTSQVEKFDADKQEKESAQGELDAAEATARTLKKELEEAKAAHEKANAVSLEAQRNTTGVKLKNEVGRATRKYETMQSDFELANEAVEEAKTGMQVAQTKDEAAAARIALGVKMQERDRATSQRNDAQKDLAAAWDALEKVQLENIQLEIMKSVKRMRMKGDEQAKAEASLVQAKEAEATSSEDEMQAHQRAVERAEGDVQYAAKMVADARANYMELKRDEVETKKAQRVAKAKRELHLAEGELQESKLQQASALNTLQGAKAKLVNATLTIAEESEVRSEIRKAKARFVEVTESVDDSQTRTNDATAAVEAQKLEAAQKAQEATARQALLLGTQTKALEQAVKDAQAKLIEATLEQDKEMAQSALDTAMQEAEQVTQAQATADKQAQEAASTLKAVEKSNGEAKLARLQDIAKTLSKQVNTLRDEQVEVVAAVKRTEQILANATSDQESELAQEMLSGVRDDKSQVITALDKAEAAETEATEAAEAEEENMKKQQELAKIVALSDEMSTARVAVTDLTEKAKTAKQELTSAQEVMSAASSSEERQVAELKLDLAEKEDKLVGGLLTNATLKVKTLGTTLQKARLMMDERSEESKVLELEEAYQTALMEAAEANNVVQLKRGQDSSNASMQALTTAADTANRKMTEAGKELAEQEAELKAQQQQRAGLATTTAEGKTQIDSSIAQREQARQKRESVILSTLPTGSELWIEQLGTVEKVKMDAVAKQEKAVVCMDEGPAKTNATLKMLNLKEATILEVLDAVAPMEAGAEKETLTWRLEGEQESVHSDLRVAILGLEDDAAKEQLTEDLEAKEKALLEKQEKIVEGMDDGEEKNTRLGRLMVKRQALFPNEPSAEEKRLLEEKRKKEEEARAAEEAARNAANAEAEAAKAKEAEVENALKEEEALVQALQAGNASLAERIMGDAAWDAAMEANESSSSELEEAIAKIAALKAEKAEAIAAVEAAERKKRALSDTNFIKMTTHREATENETALVRQHTAPLSTTQRMQLGKMSAKERRDFLYQYYLQYQKHWHSVVHVPRSHEVLLNVSTRLAYHTNETREEIMKAKATLMQEKREFAETQRSTKAAQVAELAKVRTSMAEEKAAATKTALEEAKEKLKSALEASKESRNKREEFELELAEEEAARRELELD